MSILPLSANKLNQPLWHLTDSKVEIVNSMLYYMVLMSVVKGHQGICKPTMKLPLLLQKANNIWVPPIQEITTNTGQIRGQIQQSYKFIAVIT